MASSKEFLDIILPIVSLLIGAIGTYMGVRSFQRERQQEATKRLVEAEKKSYAAERDFNHIQRNYEQLIANVSLIAKDTDQRFDEIALELKELKGLINVLLMKLSGENTTGYRRRDEGRDG